LTRRPAGSQAADIRRARKALQLPLSLERALVSDLPRLLRPTHKAFTALAVPAPEALAEDIAALLERLNVAGKSSLVVPSEYLGVVIVKR
jgi:hypothetical protein